MMNKSVVVLIISLLSASTSVAQNFFHERYRGWLWFEDRSQKAQKTSHPLTRIEMELAKRDNETTRAELDLLRHVIVRYPDNLEYIKLYKEKEKAMLSKSVTLARNFIMVDFLNPDIANNLDHPQNLYGRFTKREIEQENNVKTLKKLSENVELFLFIKKYCKYSELLEKHLARFADRYGFKVEVVSDDIANSSKFFKTTVNRDLVQILGLKNFPVVIAVTNDSRMRFELARGAVSVADLEENGILAMDYINSINRAH